MNLELVFSYLKVLTSVTCSIREFPGIFESGTASSEATWASSNHSFKKYKMWLTYLYVHIAQQNDFGNKISTLHCTRSI